MKIMEYGTLKVPPSTETVNKLEKLSEQLYQNPEKQSGIYSNQANAYSRKRKLKPGIVL